MKQTVSWSLIIDVLECPSDLNNDGLVGIADLLTIIDAWGFCGSCPADINNDGAVNVTDLLTLINSWGECP